MRCMIVVPPEKAAELRKNAGGLYCPDNPAHRMMFCAVYCDRCAHQFTCEILAKTLTYRPCDDEYPTDWRIGDDGQPVCGQWAHMEPAVVHETGKGA